MKKFWQDFKKFITRGNVVDMAVGVAVASAFTAIVTAFTKGFITPLLALITGSASVSDMKWVIRPEELDAEGAVITKEISILWGGLVQAIIDFLIIAIALFIVMRVASYVSGRTRKLTQAVRDKFTDEDEKAAAAEAKAAAEAEAKAAAEAEAAALAKAKEEAEINEEKARRVREEKLLEEIRDLLKKQ